MHLAASTRGTRRTALVLSAAALSATLAFGGVLGAPTSALAATPATYSSIILGIGANETQRSVTWYTDTDSDQVVQLAPTATLQAGEFPASAVSFGATRAANVAGTTAGFNQRAVLSGLQENTQYSYRVGSEDNWSAAYSFKTQSFEGSFDFLFFGDPQIGASGNVANDGAGWADTLEVALSNNPDTELLVSGGDQVETANTESQWTAFLASDRLCQVSGLVESVLVGFR